MSDVEASRGATIEIAGGPLAVLCLHGLTGSPYELRPLAERLGQAGYHVLVPRLVGHGLQPESLAHTRWQDWLASARRAFDGLAQRHERVSIVGLSMGALLAVVIAHERGARVGALALLSTPLRLDLQTQLAFRVSRLLPFMDVMPFVEKSGGPDVSDAGVAAAMPSYDRVPLAAVSSIVEGQAAARERLPLLSMPVLVQHGRFDHTAPLHNAHRTFGLLRTPKRRLIVYPRSWHILPLDVEGETVAADVLDFLNRMTGGLSRAPEATA